MAQYGSAYSGLPPQLIAAVIGGEDASGDPNAVSSAGAIGPMQLMPGTAKDLGVDPRNPVQNVIGGARYLRQMLAQFGGNLALALWAYNQGPGAVQAAGGNFAKMPAVTRAYIQGIYQRLGVA